MNKLHRNSIVAISRGAVLPAEAVKNVERFLSAAAKYGVPADKLFEVKEKNSESFFPKKKKKNKKKRKVD